MVILLALNLLTGLRIGWGYLESPLGGATGWVAAVARAIAPKGTLLGVNLITLHVTLAFLMLFVVGVYLVYLFGTPAWRRLRVTLKDFQNLSLTGLRVNGFWHHKQALWSANLLVYWLSFFFIGLLLVTGMALYRLDWGLSSVLGGYNTARWLHGVIAYLFVPYVILHTVLQWGFGRFWSIFKAQLYRPHIRAGFIGVTLALPVACGLYAWDAVPPTLTALRIPEHMPAPILDGDPGDPVWRYAQAVTIPTVKGMNNVQEPVEVTLKALHDGKRVYFQFQWADPDASYKRLPLRKTRDGWKVLQTTPMDWADENVYYEDKLAMYITDVPNGGCTTTCHIGVGPHSDKDQKHGVHYTNGEVGDVWHWKAVRTNPMGELSDEPAHMDDQHFRAPEPVPAQLTERYTAGYYPDPNTGGGYRYNFEKLEPDKPLSEAVVRPLFLPPTDDIRPNSDPATSDHKDTWWIHTPQGIPYSEEADTYPIGTLIPNMLIDGPFQGDRGDVKAKATWHDGHWTLEARRVLDTKSAYDVALTLEKPVYISVGIFNRTQTRHTEHIKPIQLVLEK
jgi:thiosulfate reductase cytochrome b subunit